MKSVLMLLIGLLLGFILGYLVVSLIRKSTVVGDLLLTEDEYGDLYLSASLNNNPRSLYGKNFVTMRIRKINNPYYEDK